MPDRPARREFGQRGDGLVEVEVGRRRRGAQHAAVGQLHADGVAGEEHPAQRVVQPDVVFGVARRVDGGQGAARADLYLLAVVEHVQPLGRGGVEPPVERVEQRAVDEGGGVDEAGGVGQVPGPLLVHVDAGRREGAGHVTDAAGVVEVDVGDGHPGQLGWPHPDLGQRRQQHGHRGLASRLDQHRRRALNEVAGGDVLPAAQQGVDLEDALGDGPRRRHGRNGVAALGVVHVQPGVGVPVRVSAVGVRPAHEVAAPINAAPPPVA